MPGHTLVVNDPDTTVFTDILVYEHAHKSKRVGALALLQDARPGELWAADRHLCTHTLLQR